MRVELEETGDNVDDVVVKAVSVDVELFIRNFSCASRWYSFITLEMSSVKSTMNKNA